MVDKSWREGVQLEVAHPVASHHHGCLLAVEGIDNTLQGIGSGIEVVRVELHGKTSATAVVDCFIPTSADS